MEGAVHRRRAPDGAQGDAQGAPAHPAGEDAEGAVQPLCHAGHGAEGEQRQRPLVDVDVPDGLCRGAAPGDLCDPLCQPREFVFDEQTNPPPPRAKESITALNF